MPRGVYDRSKRRTLAEHNFEEAVREEPKRVTLAATPWVTVPEKPNPQTNGTVIPENIQGVANIRAALQIFENFDQLPLATKLAYIMGMIGTVPKTGYNAFHKYRYTMETDLVAAIRPYLSAAGIIIVPTVLKHEKDGNLTILTVRFTIMDGLLDAPAPGAYPVHQANRQIVMEMVAYGSDTGDKGAAKAMTSAVKYALMKTFLIDTGDDPEADERTDRDAVRRTMPNIKIEDHDQVVGRGGHAAKITSTQKSRISALVREKSLGKSDLIASVNIAVEGLEDIDGLEDDADRDEIQLYLSNMPNEAASRLIGLLEAMQLPATIQTADD